MAKRPYRRCRVCGSHESEVGAMSKRGLCPEHSDEAIRSGVMDMVEHRGDNFQRWRRAMAATVGGVLLEDLRRVEG